MSTLTNALLASVVSAGVGASAGVALSTPVKADLYETVSAEKHAVQLTITARDDIAPDGGLVRVWDTRATYVIPSLVPGMAAERVEYLAPTDKAALPGLINLTNASVTPFVAARAGLHSAFPYPDGGTP